MQRGDQAFVVSLMQADGRFVKYIHHAHQSGTDLRRQTDTLCLAARQGLGRTGQRQVVESDVVEKSKAGTNLLQNFACDLSGRSFKLQAIRPYEAFLGGHVTHVGDGLAANGHCQYLRAKSTSLACLAWHFAHVRFVVLFHLVGIGLVVPAHQCAHYTFKTGGVFAHATPTITI